MKLNKNFLLIILLILSNYSPALAGISLGKTSGLINIPTATVVRDRQLTIGLGIVNKNSAYLETGRCDNFPFYIVIGYLPRLEFSAGVNFVPGRSSYDGSDTYKDGVVSLQYLMLNEGKFLPAIAVGCRDIYSFILLNTFYMIASKTIIQRQTTSVKIHVGYGSDVIDRHIGVPKQDRKYPVRHTIIGAFGGLEIECWDRIFCMLEYDSQKINSGFRFKLNLFVSVDIDWLNMEDISGNMNFSFGL